MDLYCRKCGEPWDFDSLHDEAQSRMAGAPCTGPTYDRVFRTVGAEFRRDGCSVLGGRCSKVPDTDVDDDGLSKADKAGIVYDLLGDDMDGAASMLDDT